MPAAEGDGVRRASWWGTAVFALTSTAAAVWPSVLTPVAVVVDVVLFGTGTAAFLWAYFRVVARSRMEQISVGAVYFLSGETAPQAVRRSLLASLVAQVVVGLATAGVRPYTSLAAGTLVPVYGLGLCGVWAARYGRFPPRQRGPRAG